MFFICSEVMRHNVKSGKSDGGHLGFMQVRPLVLKDFCPPPKNITKYILKSPCAKFHEFIPKCTPGPKIWTVSIDLQLLYTIQRRLAGQR